MKEMRMTKPTGRPRGRPKTSYYVTMMARVPQELADRVQRYASHKRQTLSDVLRDGLLVLLQEDDLYRPFAPDTPQPLIVSDSKEDTSPAPTLIVSDIKEDEDMALAPAPPSFVSDTNMAFDTTKFYLGKLCPRGHDFAGTGKSLLRTHNQHCRACEAASKRARRQAQAAPTGTQDVHNPQPDALAAAPQATHEDLLEGTSYDSTRYRLGKLCPRGHDYQGTGHSLVRKDKGDCRECDIEKKRARRQAKRQQEATP